MGVLELWKPVVGYEGFYEVSSLGRVKSVARFRRGKNGAVVPVPERIMKLRTHKCRPESTRQRPYQDVQLRNGGPREQRAKLCLVHRLVAEAFIGEIPEDFHVDHINGIHADNRVENLRIVSPQDHYRWHPVVVHPLPRSNVSGRFMSRNNALAMN